MEESVSVPGRSIAYPKVRENESFAERMAPVSGSHTTSGRWIASKISRDATPFLLPECDMCGSVGTGSVEDNNPPHMSNKECAVGGNESSRRSVRGPC